MKKPVFEKRHTDAVFVEARYQPSDVPEYRGNPLIEALPPLLPNADWQVLFQRLPEFDATERLLPADVRMHCAMSLRKLFVVQGRHIEVREKLDLVLRAAYVGVTLHPADRRRRAQQLYECLQTRKLPTFSEDGAASGESFSLVGSSGMGKSYGVNRYRSWIPAVIRHSKHQELQIPIIYVVCPHNGSTKDFALSLLRAIDAILGTSYEFDCRGLGEEQLIATAAGLFDRYFVGLLIIDEVQSLSHRKSGGREEFLDFFLKLFNSLHLSIVVIGTMKAVKVLQTTFRQARRVSSLGSLYWVPFRKEDKDWQRLVTALWPYQWLPVPTPWSDEINDVLHEETQGNTSLLVRLFILAQHRAIRLHDHPLTPALIRQVARDNFKLLQPMLDALRSRNPARIAKFEDFQIPELEEFPEISGLAERALLKLTESPEGIAATKRDTRRKALDALVQLEVPEAAALWHVNSILGEEPHATSNRVVAETLARLEGKTGKNKVRRTKKDAVTKPHIPEDYDALVAKGWIAPLASGDENGAGLGSN